METKHQNPFDSIAISSPIAVYLRKSRLEDGGNEEETLAKHRKEVKTFIDGVGFEDVTWFEEVESGESIENRPKMIHLLENITEGKYRAVVAVHIDRLSRGDMFDRGYMVKAFKESNTLLYTTSNSKVYDFNTETNDALLTEIELMFSNQEYKTIRRRLMEGKNRAFESGKVAGGKLPYGYFKDYNTNTYHIDEEQAKVYHWIVEKYLSGLSTHAIAMELNKNGILPPSGRKSASWSNNFIQGMFKNPFYTGRVVRNRETSTKVGTKVHVRYNDPSEYETRQGSHEAMISDETYDKLLKTLVRNRRRPASRRRNTHRLSGLVRCGCCGYMVSLQGYKHPDDTITTYVRKCFYPLGDGTKCDSNMGLKEEILVNVLREGMFEYKEKLFEENDVETVEELEVDELSLQNDRIEVATGKLDRAKVLFIDGDIDKGAYDALKQRENAEIEEARKRIAEIMESPEVALQEERESWKNVDLEELFFGGIDKKEFNRIIKTLVESISYIYRGKDGLEVDIKYL